MNANPIIGILIASAMGFLVIVMFWLLWIAATV